jgi:ABC-2 type transport system ATP-binding protein
MSNSVSANSVKQSATVQLVGVRKRYGQVSALNGLDLSIARGSCCGLVGPNGAGKTTAMGVIAGLILPDAGSVSIFGEGPFSARKHAGRLGMMPQDCSPNPHMSLHALLCFYAELQGIDKHRSVKEADRVLDAVGLSDRRQAVYPQLSHGMRRRFSVAQALLGEPELVILDEPTSGLDPEHVAQLRQVLLRLRGRTTLLISSHILSELEALCDSVAFVEDGKCLRQGSLREITQSLSIARYTLTQPPNFERLNAKLPGHSFEWDSPVLTVQPPTGQPITLTNAQVLRELLEQEIGILDVQGGQSLETSYLTARQNRAQ